MVLSVKFRASARDFLCFYVSVFGSNSFSSDCNADSPIIHVNRCSCYYDSISNLEVESLFAFYKSIEYIENSVRVY